MKLELTITINPLLSQDQGSIRWSHIVQSFDSTGNPLLLLSPLGFPLFLALLLNPPQAPNPPIAGLLSYIWSNPLPQLVLIDRLLSLPSDTFNFSALPSPQRIITREDVADAPLAFVNSTWNCKDIFEVCGKAAASEDAGVREKSKDIIDKGVKAAPEVVFLGMVQSTVSLVVLPTMRDEADASFCSPAETLASDLQRDSRPSPRLALRAVPQPHRRLHPSLAARPRSLSQLLRPPLLGFGDEHQRHRRHRPGRSRSSSSHLVSSVA